jgi:nucleotide-binding universal stress UspA family protein
MLIGENPQVTVMTVVQVPRSFLEALDDTVRRSFLDDDLDDQLAAEEKAARYLEERGQRAVDPICAALAAEGIETDVRFVEGDDPAEAIINTAEQVGAEMVIMGATRRLFTEEAWKSVSARVMVNSRLPVLLVPGTKIEDTQEMPVIELSSSTSYPVSPPGRTHEILEPRTSDLVPALGGRPLPFAASIRATYAAASLRRLIPILASRVDT